jgi:hypothetical protein
MSGGMHTSRWGQSFHWHDQSEGGLDAVIAEVEGVVLRDPPTVSRSELHSLAARVSACESGHSELSERVASLESGPTEDFAGRHVRLAARVREEALKLSGVTAAYLHPCELTFTLVGPTWTAELSEAGAALASKLQHELVPDLSILVDGGFEVAGSDAPAQWHCLLP